MIGQTNVAAVFPEQTSTIFVVNYNIVINKFSFINSYTIELNGIQICFQLSYCLVMLKHMFVIKNKNKTLSKFRLVLIGNIRRLYSQAVKPAAIRKTTAAKNLPSGGLVILKACNDPG